MFELLAHFHFLRPEWLLLSLPLLALEIYSVKRQRPANASMTAIDPELRGHLEQAPSRQQPINPDSLFVWLLSLLIITAAGPSWRQQPTPLAEDAAALVIVLDVSRSMDSRDVAPSRLQRAQQKMQDLLNRLPNKPVAVIIYAGSAHTVLPLSMDHDIVRNYLASLSTDIAPTSGKLPELALPSINRALVAQKGNANILWVTDGIGQTSASEVRSWCRTHSHELVIYGVGSEQVEPGLVPLERKKLVQLANDCHGRYFDISVDTTDVDAIAQHMTSLYRVIDDQGLPWLDGGVMGVWPALLLTLFWFRRGWTRYWLWLYVPLIVWSPEPASAQAAQDRSIRSSSPTAAVEQQDSSAMALEVFDAFVGLWLTPDQYGRLLLELGYYQHALTTFESTQWRAVAAYYAEDFEQAKLLFSRQSGALGAFNEANARAQQRDYVGALTSYDNALKQRAGFRAALENRERVQQIVDDIDRLSASQQDEEGVSAETADAEEPQPGNGDERTFFESENRPTYSADELLASPEVTELWLKGVQQDPQQFLRTKFRYQVDERGVSEQ